MDGTTERKTVQVTRILAVACPECGAAPGNACTVTDADVRRYDAQVCGERPLPHGARRDVAVGLCPRCGARLQRTQLTPPSDGEAVGCVGCSWPDVTGAARGTPPARPLVRVGSPAHVAVWDAIKAFSLTAMVSPDRQRAVVRVERALNDLFAEVVPDSYRAADRDSSLTVVARAFGIEEWEPAKTDLLPLVERLVREHDAALEALNRAHAAFRWLGMVRALAETLGEPPGRTHEVEDLRAGLELLIVAEAAVELWLADEACDAAAVAEHLNWTKGAGCAVAAQALQPLREIHPPLVDANGCPLVEVRR